MGLGVLEDRVMEHVPGTTRYFDDPDRPQIAGEDTHGLKCDRSGPVPIILVPQPSDDPNDPLNWPLWKRDTILCILSLNAIFATALGPILAANSMFLSIWQFDTTFGRVALLTGYYLLGVGVAGVLFVPSARIWGKRHLFLLGTVLLIASNVWAGSTRHYKSFLWARIIQGVGTAPFEALLNVAVGDLYFVHQRGKRMALTNLAVFGGAFCTPILVGRITKNIGWWWTFYFIAIFCGACLPALVFFVPEVAFRRSAHLNTDYASSDDLRLRSKQADPVDEQRNSQNDGSLPERPLNTAETDAEAEKHTAVATNGNLVPDQVIPKKASYIQSLKPFNGRKTDESFWKLFFRPFPLFGHPAILWCCLTQGTLIGWTVFIGVMLGSIFLGPPLWWNEVNTGYAYTGPLVGAILGFVVAGSLADWSAKWMTRHNNGVYEPEFRILLVIPQLIIGSAGLFGFGVVAPNLVEYSWFWPIFFFGMVVMGMVIGAVASALYIVDAHRDIAIEAFTCMMIFKNIFCFGLTFSAYNWLLEGSSETVFLSIAGIQVFICLLSVPMYVFGKRNRSFFHRHDILTTFHLR